jgi:hypothetical protein
MSTGSTRLDETNPALAFAFGQLRESMYGCIDNIEYLLAEYPDEVVLSLARNEIPRLISAIRGVVAEHRPDADGRCAGCGFRRTETGYQLEIWPCRAINAVHVYLKDPERVFDDVGEEDPL